MLHIYYGRENIDKERFLFDRIRKDGWGPDRPVILIVPDQYTLDCERQALRYLETESLVGIDVVSLSRLEQQVLSDGGGRETFIDQYGRQMLLTKIVRSLEPELVVFGRSARRNSFLSLANDFISQMKQYGVDAQALAAIIEPLSENGKDTLLAAKLGDLQKIYAKYEEETRGIYRDSEDAHTLAVSRIPGSRRIRGRRVWVYGFDTFAPKSLAILEAVAEAAEDLSVVLTCDDDKAGLPLFDLTRGLIRRLREDAEERGVPCEVVRAASDAAGIRLWNEKPEALRYLESALPDPKAAAFSGRPGGIHLVAAANQYSEAETAASYIRSLLRKGFRLREIAVVVNDQEKLAPACQRVFREYGMDAFLDVKRNILDEPLAVYVLSLLTASRKRWRSADVIRALKTGLSPVPDTACEKLENYVIKYRVNGWKRWNEPFTLGTWEYTEEDLAELNAAREQTCGLMAGIDEIRQSAKTNEAFCGALYRFLTGPSGVRERMEDLARRQEEAGLADAAEETVQMWQILMHLLDQIVGLVGGEPFHAEEFEDLMTEGLREIEVGVLPPGVDGLRIGTLQRTRSAEARAVVIIGANEGVLPKGPEDGGLFAQEELERLADGGHELCKLDRVRAMEERMALYRLLSKPKDALWVGYAASGENGEPMHASEVVETLRVLFPSLEPEPDIVSAGKEEALIDAPDSTLRHLTERLSRAARRGEPADPVWSAVLDWYRARGEARITRLEAGLADDNSAGRLGPRGARLLFGRPGAARRALSPSRLEMYAGCPFSFFVQYALRPEERRVYEASTREVGDLYHHCILAVTSRLSAESRWESVTAPEISALVADAVKAETESYREGLFRFSHQEGYRAGRLQTACERTVAALVAQARAGRIRESAYELSFGEGGTLPAIEVDLPDGKVYVEGRIDRVDILENGRVKIIDYKSGNRELKKNEIRAGASLQLMLYLRAAENGERKPAGVFYFHIQDPRVPDQGTEDEIRAAVRSSFQMHGLLVDDEETIREVAGELGPSESSDVVSVKMKKDGTPAASGTLISEEDFDALQDAVIDRVRELCAEMDAGEIPISPMKIDGKQTDACTHCSFRSICRFDPRYTGNRPRRVRKD